jgi:hypothetical protein
MKSLLKYIIAYVLFGLFVFLAIVLSGCGSNYHLRRAEHHLKKAEVKGAVITSDTVFRDIIIPEVKFDTVVQVESFSDTITIEKDRIVTKVKVNTITKEIYVATKCPPDTVRVETVITKEIYPAKGWKDYLPWIIVILAVGVAAYFIRSIRKK